MSNDGGIIPQTLEEYYSQFDEENVSLLNDKDIEALIKSAKERRTKFKSLETVLSRSDDLKGLSPHSDEESDGSREKEENDLLSSTLIDDNVIKDGLPEDLLVYCVGRDDNTEVLPATEGIINPKHVPCGLPPKVLWDDEKVLSTYTDNIEYFPAFDKCRPRNYLREKTDVSALLIPEIVSTGIEFDVKRDSTTGKLLGFVEVPKDNFGTHKTSTALSRLPGPPDAGVKGSSSSYIFWPGGMDEPLAELFNQEPVDTSLFDSEYLDTPPGFENGMKFDHVCDPEKPSTVDEMRLAEILSVDDMPDLQALSEPEDDSEHVSLDKLRVAPVVEEEKKVPHDDTRRLAELPVLKISEAVISEDEFMKASYKWAVIENISDPMEDFHKQIPVMAYEWPFELDVFQKKAILYLENCENVFVAAHTSAGKTVVAEYAIALAKKNMTRVIYTSPIKALSNQKFRDFKESFDDVGLITGDIMINPTAFCLIMTTEILRSMLYNGSDVVREVEWVIFDEVHYINDPERGVVWEEVFIMLPNHVNLIMLSATVPNTAEFAEWLGGIKKRKVHVISTLKRPVPLEYFLYTGTVGKTQNENFLIVDKTGKFLDHMYTKALAAKKEKESKFKATTGPKGPRYNVSLAQDKNIYIGLLGYLKKNELLPVVCFTLSRKKCKEHAESLLSQDMTTAKEKEEIVQFFRRSISRLRKEDRELTQIKTMEEQLSLGFGVHHSGILPLLKEIVEMLFQRGLIKVLFATETFAMGVNMPARTVVFDSIRKHDGKVSRDLKPSEFIQMAGRAGRRGLDETGTVIVLCKESIPDIVSLQTMMMGKPTKLESQFKLTYSMLLNLLKVKTLRVEDIMRRSFGESSSQKQCEQFQTELLDAMDRLAKLTKPDCSLCSTDLEEYCVAFYELQDLAPVVLEKTCLQAINSKILTVGRIVLLLTSYHKNVPGLILDVDKENNCKVLVIAQETDSQPEEVPWCSSIYFPDVKMPSVVSVIPREVRTISSSVLKVNAEGVLKEWKAMEDAKCYSGPHMNAAFELLIQFCDSYRDEFPVATISFNDINYIDKYIRYQKLSNSLGYFTSIRCPDFSKHFKQISEIMDLEQEINQYKYKMSEESLSLHTEFQARKTILKKLEYIDEHEDLRLKGSVARAMSNHELVVTELLVKSAFSNCSSEEVVALLSSMVFQNKCYANLKDLGLGERMLKKIEEIKEMVSYIDDEQRKCGIEEPNFVDQYNFHLSHVVYEWAKGVSFAAIMKTQTVEVEEGIIVRTIQRLSELLKEVRKAASLLGDVKLGQKMEDAARMIKRDIVFAVSLYTQQ